MKPEILQMISQLAVLIGIIVTALGGFGAFHFGKVITQVKEQAAQNREKQFIDKIDGLAKDNKIVQDKLKPFENLANKMYPDIESDAALGRLYREIQDVKKETQPTVLIPDNLSERELENGSFEYSFNLESEGKNVIPIFSIVAESTNGAKINSLKIDGKTLPLMSENSGNKEQTAKRVLYRSVSPSSFKVVINTAEKTQLKISIIPLKESK